MSKRLTKYTLGVAGVALAVGFAWSAAQAAPIPLGYISWDVTNPGFSGEFDITNQTGVNSSSPTWPVSTTVLFNSLSLTVDFSDGSTQTFGPSYFTLASDGQSLNGNSIAIGGVSPQPTEAILTGDLAPTSVLVNGTPMTLDSSFDTATILPSSPPNLSDGDFAIINAEPASVAVPAPPIGFGLPVFLAVGLLLFGAKFLECIRRGARLFGVASGMDAPPGPESDRTWTLQLGGIMTRIFARRLRRHGGVEALASAARFGGAVGALLAIGIVFPAVSFAATTVQQNTASTPSSGVAGVSFINITATGFPSGPINPANVTIKLAPTCTVGASSPVAGEADATATSVKTILGSSDRVNFEVPSHLLSGAPITTGTYMAQIVDTTDGFSGGNCSIVMVTATSTTLNACVPSSSMGVVAGTTVTAYVPKSCWSCGANTGVSAVQIEPTLGGSSSVIATASPVNACAGNPSTAQVVCTANNTSVYAISGTTLTNTLTSGLTGFASFSGGSCNNCGVAINALTNTAAISGGAPAALGGGDGVQILNLNTSPPTFQPVFKMTQTVSEDISIDPGRNLLLSPNENSNYPLLTLNSTTGAVTGELDRNIANGENDSAAEDCSTGIALSSVEFTFNVFLADLSQATLTAGSPGSWTSPSTSFVFTGQSLGFSAGTSGISVAQGSSHLAFVTGEFGGNTFGVMQLQSASGTGGAVPTVSDWVVGAMPNVPGAGGGAFSAGCDPHTMTAYTSPNTGKAIGLYSDWPSGCSSTPKFIGVIDLAAALAAPRAASPNTHQIAPTVNLIATGIVTYVAVP
jgi:hypothetical protein